MKAYPAHEWFLKQVLAWLLSMVLMRYEVHHFIFNSIQEFHLELIVSLQNLFCKYNVFFNKSRLNEFLEISNSLKVFSEDWTDKKFLEDSFFSRWSVCTEKYQAPQTQEYIFTRWHYIIWSPCSLVSSGQRPMTILPRHGFEEAEKTKLRILS